MNATGEQAFRTDPWEQLIRRRFEAVFKQLEHAQGPMFYRNHEGIDHDMGTAVTVMTMVFGNLGPTSGTGVLFTRNPVQTAT